MARRLLRRAVAWSGLAAALVLPSGAAGATIIFDGTFAHGPADNKVHFTLTHDGDLAVHGWSWRHIPIQCREGSDFNSGHYPFDVTVDGHHFRIASVLNHAEGSRTTLDGVLTNHNRKAHGTLTMRGGEPPKTHCHGGQHWTATGVKLGDLVYRKGTFDAPGGQATSQFKTCPEDHQGIAGGGVDLFGDPLVEASRLLLVGDASPAFSPLDPDSFGARANNSGVPAASMAITAICSNAHLQHRTQLTNFAPGDRSTVDVSCPSGTHVVGGGVSASIGTSANNLVRIQSSRPADSNDPGATPDDGWVGSVINDSTTDTAVVVTSAICSDDNEFDYVHSSRIVVDPENEAQDLARCPSDTGVSGGGVEVTGADAGIMATIPFDSGDQNSVTDDGWFARGTNGSPSSAHTMQVFAICER